VAIDVHVECEMYELAPAQEEQSVGRVHHVADLGPFRLLDAVATCDAGGRQLTLAVVNRDRDRSHAAAIELTDAAATGGVLASEVNGPDVGATNSFEHPRQVDVRERRLDYAGRRFEYTFPAHSITVLRMSLA
jgi:alpha-N-arabinofuranosidase